jgi:hypothetical protein
MLLSGCAAAAVFDGGGAEEDLRELIDVKPRSKNFVGYYNLYFE